MTNKSLSVDQFLTKAKSLAKKGELNQAMEFYRAVLEKFPGNKRAIEGLKSLEWPEPDQKQIDVLITLYKRGRFQEMLAQGTALAERHPNVPLIQNLLGGGNVGLGRFNQAVASYTKALQIWPDYAEAHNNLGIALRALEKHEEAIASYTKALQVKPDYAEAHSNLGNALFDLGKHEEAIANYTKALQVKPDNAEVHKNLGIAFAAIGKHEAAIASYTKALQIKPYYGEAHWNLGTLKKYHRGDPQIAQMLEPISNPLIAKNDQVYLSFALGKAYGDIGDAESSFKYFLEGNQLRKQELGYDIGADERLFGQVKSIFEENDLLNGEETRPVTGCKKKPIFIVGMPRSGTTLVEQILASHSQIFGAGELTALNRIVSPIIHDTNKAYDGKFTGKVTKLIREEYVAELDKLRCDEAYITDKMPLNFRWIGFILSALPEAKIINVQRDQIATCWSIFKNNFSSSGNRYAYDLVDVSEYYGLYLDLMGYWHEKFPNKIYDLNYEALTDNQEEETRKLLKYCGLDWEDNCLEFHKTERLVKTASSHQVRREMYKGSSEAWREYETHIQPMLQVLERLSPKPG